MLGRLAAFEGMERPKSLVFLTETEDGLNAAQA